MIKIHDLVTACIVTQNSEIPKLKLKHKKIGTFSDHACPYEDFRYSVTLPDLPRSFHIV